jgi:outer membrane receptor protein involved in Fe transport
MVNASITWKSPDSHWRVIGEVKNATNVAVVGSTLTSAVADEILYQAPRTFWVSAGYSF